jgi:hypothetical protein
MDFTRLLNARGKGAPIEPRELWASLPDKASGYGYLRDVQGQVLSAWHDRRGERDLVIKVNTGGGKTIDGLLILQSYLNEGHGPALYVAPDKYLAEQVGDEAARLGIVTVEDPDSPRYLSGEAIAIVNASKLVNGKTVFSANRPSRPPVPIGSVVIDDAHAAIATTRERLSVSVPTEHPAYDEMLELFKEELEQQSPNELLDVRDGTHAALARVPFWAWRAKADRTRELLHAHRASEPFEFSWPAVREVLPFSRAVFTGSALTITPFCPPIRHITGFAEAQHRIYLTATLADDSVLVTDFGADPASVRNPITPLTAGDIGERMIIAPQELNPSISADSVRDAVAALAAKLNIVVLVPSARAANVWRGHANKIVSSSDGVASTVMDLRNGHVGLVVFINRYDGIDLPGEACRVLVLDGLPEVATGDERVEAQVLRQAGTDDRQVQRIEQGMGRGVRSNEDHCVVFLVGSRLAQLVADPRSFVRFSPATRAQLDLARDVASDLRDRPLDDIMAVAQQALDRDTAWVKFARLALASIAAPAGMVSDFAVARRRAFEAATDGDHRRAADLIGAAAGSMEGDRAVGWALEQKAAYLDAVDPAAAQDILAVARTKNQMVLRPLTGLAAYKRLSAAGDQAQRAADHLAACYSTGSELRLAAQTIADGLAFDPDRTEEAEEAFRRLADHIGLAGQRPEREIGSGPDVLWALGGLNFWVIEAKTGAISDVIHKRDAAQLGHSMAWFRGRYDQTARATPVMVHRARRMARDATASPGTRVLDEDGLRQMRVAFLAYAAGLASSRWDTPGVVADQLAGHTLRAAELVSYLRGTQPSR